MSRRDLTVPRFNFDGKRTELVQAVIGSMGHIAPIVALAIMTCGFAWFEPRMLSIENVANVGLQASLLFIVTVAQLLPIIVRGFDLSIGTVVSLGSVLGSMAAVSLADDRSDIGVAFGITVVTLATGIVVGVINGIAVARLKVDPFITTLATFNICLGIALTVSEGIPIAELPASVTYIFAGNLWSWIPVPVAVALGVSVCGHVLLRHTVLGRSLYLVGSNPDAARVAGVRVQIVTLTAYACAGLLTGITALLLTARVGSGEPTLGGTALTVQSIVAVVVGGVSLAGGNGTIWNCVVGALFVTILSNGMNMVRFNGFAQPIVLGALIIAAAFLAARRRGTV